MTDSPQEKERGLSKKLDSWKSWARKKKRLELQPEEKKTHWLSAKRDAGCSKDAGQAREDLALEELPPIRAYGRNPALGPEFLCEASARKASKGLSAIMIFLGRILRSRRAILKRTLTLGGGPVSVRGMVGKRKRTA